jgi:hypothetical protein
VVENFLLGNLHHFCDTKSLSYFSFSQNNFCFQSQTFIQQFFTCIGITYYRVLNINLERQLLVVLSTQATFGLLWARDLTRALQKRLILSARARSFRIEYLLISIGSSQAEPKIWIPPPIHISCVWCYPRGS